MPSKKKKYNARFPAGRIKKIMQTDEEVGKVAQAVPVIISRTLELFVESLLTKSAQITLARNAKTLTPSHMKQCILSESRFDFLKDLVKNIPDATSQEDAETPPLDMTGYQSDTPSIEQNFSPRVAAAVQTPTAIDFTPNFYTEQSTSSKTPSVIQYGSRTTTTTTSSKPEETPPPPKIDFSIKSLVQKDPVDNEPKIHIDLTNIIRQPCADIPPLIPLARNSLYNQNNTDNLCIDEDYDN